MKRTLNPDRKIWRKGEFRFCEVRFIEYTRDYPIIHLTHRGAAELRRRERAEKKEQAAIKRYNRRCGNMRLWIWWLFGPFGRDGKPVFP